MAPSITAKYDWILALTTIAFVFSALGNGANDVANSYATSVAARTLTMPQAGVLAACTEFVGATALGSRVTATIKSGIISLDRFTDRPGTLMLAMGCAEVGSASWLAISNTIGFPVSTTQTIVGSLVGVGFASQSKITWEWKKGSVSQTAASWGVAPLIAAGFAAFIFGTLKYSILDRQDSFKKAMRAIPFYIAFTCAILALFIVVETPSAPSLEEFGAGKAVGVILGVFFGVLAIAYTFFIPYFERRLVKMDARVKFYHLPLGPLLKKENPPLYFPGRADGSYVTDYYASPYASSAETTSSDSVVRGEKAESTSANTNKIDDSSKLENGSQGVQQRKRALEPEERFLQPVRHLPIHHPRRLWGYVKFILLQGVTRDCVTHSDEALHGVHSRAPKYDIRVEHLWTYCQVLSAMLMSIAHGSNDVANAVGPWVASYQTFRSGEVNSKAPTPVWFLVIAGLLLGTGFWFYGYNIIRALGNRITRMSPTRGFSAELGAAITVLMASRLALPVSTTQCLTGAVVGVALMNYDVGAVNWKQVVWIFSGWVLTLPCAGLIAGLVCLMALNTPHF
ncbi:PiT family inorganic phosphate transporter [Exophiala aquamarina CBS 119918]|uniref:Phosphate transporter n=1 Tax=Exophiala aquamarina CBS 119918 TaxID=1182545 RepID=A0A072PJQ6_9EURO|nr:PiT family inorganic phosphate transporter [Exophiala aquamarina CBS 119918]KEF60309.1 PiT family inorganic phosphate transporter [Exophiala aquamarina CBS 119918]